MLGVLRSVISPIISLIILVMGSGLFMTYVTVRLRLEGYSSATVGIVSATYYAGLLLGSFRAEKIIARIGHIRAFASFASITSVCVMFQGLFVSGWLWGILRFIGGACMGGLFVAIESWLLVKSIPETRGKVLSIYMAAFYGAMAGGQFLLNISDPISLIPFAITVILSSFSVVPVSMTRTMAPVIQEPSFLNIFKLTKMAPLGMIGCTLSGMILGTVYGLLPVYAEEIQMNVTEIARLMSVTIFGGLVLQWPLGIISDHLDRRKVILISSVVTVILAVIIAILNNFIPLLLLILSGLFGGFSFALYPLCISHACDSVDHKDIVAATGGLLLAYSLGAIIGPLIAPYSITILGPKGLFIFFAIIAVLLSIAALFRIFQKPPIPEEEKVPYTNMPRTTPLASELDPRSDEENKEENEKN